LSLDGIRGPSLSSWFSAIRSVVFCPEDIAIVRGEPAIRRRFIDRAAFTVQPGHLDIVQDYRRLLKHKVVLLKKGVRGTERATFDAELARVGARLIYRRRAAVGLLTAPFKDLHQRITDNPDVSLHLRSVGLQGIEGTEAELRDALEAAIQLKSAEETERAQVLVGPHRDDLDIRIAGKLARTYASQGQSRSIVMSLKLAQWSAAGSDGDPPLFLLDDLGSELDTQRRSRLLTLLGELPGQVWVTTTNPEFIASVPADACCLLHVQDGRIVAG